MISRLTLPSPLHRLNTLSKQWGVELWVKRDDLIPQYMGGNKVRKAHAILESILSTSKPDILITNGGAKSNHARVIALMGAQLGIRVHLVLHGELADDRCRGNRYICRAAGATLHHVTPELISAKISELNTDEHVKGRSVVVIPGGGHSQEGANAYANAVGELPFRPDVIVHASGTGGTQAGLVIGANRLSCPPRVIGISVAREAEKGRAEVANLLPKELHDTIEFDDRFRFGGYEKVEPALHELNRMVLQKEGLPLDPTYTGKAMFGLARMIEAGEIKSGCRVVFWHTGGLMNLLTSKILEGNLNERP